MDRGVIVGGGLIAASFLVAVLLNRSAREEAVPVEPEPPADVCEDPPGRRPLGPGRVADTAVEDCKRATKVLQR
jgi:hypothetical protein